MSRERASKFAKALDSAGILSEGPLMTAPCREGGASATRAPGARACPPLEKRRPTSHSFARLRRRASGLRLHQDHVMSAQASDFQWEDPFHLESQLTEDERFIRDSAQAYSQEKLLPRIVDAYEKETVDPE